MKFVLRFGWIFVRERNSRKFEDFRRCQVSENLYHARALSSLTRRNPSSSLIRRSRCSQVFPRQWDRTLNEVPPAAAIFQMKNASRSDRQNLPTCVSDIAKVSVAIHNQQFPVKGSRARGAESSEVLPIP